METTQYNTEAAQKETRNTHVESELQRQEKALTQLSDGMRLMEDRLISVTRNDDGKVMADLVEPRESLVAVAERIRGNTDTIDRVGRWLFSLTERIEL